ncbi:MAG: NUDIX domain-containing protein [Lachnospiraceae bacterium]|jgi:8-oxo-dGTP diphosphatase|nr:NUDIX domain-containing protein [Lachnospiraceae bacterium]
MNVQFYESVEDELLEFAVIVSKSKGKWVFCIHKERNTYEVPGGHRERAETILEAAKRELMEETGALAFSIIPICVYSVTGKTRVNRTGEESYGMLYYAEIESFEEQLHSEMEKIALFDEFQGEWTYPAIQPLLVDEVRRRLKNKYY